MGEGRGEGWGAGLPPEIAAGIHDVSKRGGWNAPAPAEYALPTETWREVVARRQRYHEVRAKLEAGEVTEINDLITLNLNIEQFARDVIAQSEGPELLRAFWRAMHGAPSHPAVSVLDPTCGSGAFLFAALNILEPLYTACLEGMRGFLDDLRHSRARGNPRSPNALSDFRDVLQQVEKHPSERYFILKSIVLNNLYGVDIMEEAVEICKLRLFLKLVAQLERYDQIEPLPDIDFNIRAGNTLVGFTSLEAVRQAMTVTPKGQVRALSDEDRKTLARIEELAGEASRDGMRFREQQTTLGGEFAPVDKADLRDRLGRLAGELDRHLAVEYGVEPDKAADYDKWRDSHQPFHWFAEFYGIMSNGGFDVVIGNPPYVSRRKVIREYSPRGFHTERCPDIYATVSERAVNVCGNNGRTSMIVPLSLTFSSGFASLRSYLYRQSGTVWFSTFGRIPSALFSFDTRVRNTIYLAQKSVGSDTHCFTSRFHRWFDAERSTLFDRVAYSPFTPTAFNGLIPKLGSSRLLNALETMLLSSDYRLEDELTPARNGYELHFKQTAYNWLTACKTMPPVYDADNSLLPQTQHASLKFTYSEDRDLALPLANSLLLFIWWVAIGDDFHVTRTNIASAPFGPFQLDEKQTEHILSLVPELEKAMCDNVVFKKNAGKNIGNYNLAKCRHITDKADKVWLEALGLSHLWEDIELEHALVVRTAIDGG